MIVVVLKLLLNCRLYPNSNILSLLLVKITDRNISVDFWHLFMECRCNITHKYTISINLTSLPSYISKYAIAPTRLNVRIRLHAEHNRTYSRLYV